jgi:hypothetical protein
MKPTIHRHLVKNGGAILTVPRNSGIPELHTSFMLVLCTVEMELHRNVFSFGTEEKSPWL